MITSNSKRKPAQSISIPGAYAGGGSGGSGEPPFFQINFIHSMAWHAYLACKYPRYLFKVQIFIKIPTKYTETEINIGRIECASLLFQ